MEILVPTLGARVAHPPGCSRPRAVPVEHGRQHEASLSSEKCHPQLPSACCATTLDVWRRYLLCCGNMKQEPPMWVLLCSRGPPKGPRGRSAALSVPRLHLRASSHTRTAAHTHKHTRTQHDTHEAPACSRQGAQNPAYLRLGNSGWCFSRISAPGPGPADAICRPGAVCW